jgi:hypothetical protein
MLLMASSSSHFCVNFVQPLTASPTRPPTPSMVQLSACNTFVGGIGVEYVGGVERVGRPCL